MAKTLIDIPDELMSAAMELFGTATKAETVRLALAEGVRRRRVDVFHNWLVEFDPVEDLNEASVRDQAWHR